MFSSHADDKSEETIESLLSFFFRSSILILDTVFTSDCIQFINIHMAWEIAQADRHHITLFIVWL